jgi:glycerol-3-phosphate dehydrogenase
MPITEQTYLVLFAGQDPRAAVQSLLERQSKAETG